MQNEEPKSELPAQPSDSLRDVDSTRLLGGDSPDFVSELTTLINKHSIENNADVQDFILARMICGFIDAIGPQIKATLDWHGCNSVCHPSPNPGRQPRRECGVGLDGVVGILDKNKQGE